MVVFPPFSGIPKSEAYKRLIIATLNSESFVKLIGKKPFECYIDQSTSMAKDVMDGSDINREISLALKELNVAPSKRHQLLNPNFPITDHLKDDPELLLSILDTVAVTFYRRSVTLSANKKGSGFGM